jgi:hypothetical protein
VRSCVLLACDVWGNTQFVVVVVCALLAPLVALATREGGDDQ